MTDRKLHMRFLIDTRSMTLN